MRSANRGLAAGYKHPYNLLAALTALGLTTNLKLCLDAGDELSYRSGQSWLDRSGNGYDFFLGTDGSANASDPTFNGTPNQHSANEYFSFDGGDFLTYDSANETWMQNLHKDNAKFSICGFWFYPSQPNMGFFATSTSTTETGAAFYQSAGGVAIQVSNGSLASLAVTGGSAPSSGA